MPSNRNIIFNRYANGSGEDGRVGSSRTAWMEFHYTKKALDEYITKDSRVLEIGCATGYYALHYADKCREYIGVDLFPPHIEIFNKKIKENGLANVSCQVGDAVNLSEFADESFDVVLCLGPMYHLPAEERELVFAECARICKKSGIAAFAYINKLGVYVGACVHDKHREVYPNPVTSHYCFDLGTDNERPGLFHLTMPEEMEECAVRRGLAKLRNTATSWFITMCVADKMDDEKFAEFLVVTDQLVKYESCTGMADHALLICNKI